MTTYSLISTPCIQLCVLEQSTGLCIGCGRTRAEIGAWGTMDEAGRRAIMATLSERLLALTSRKSDRVRPSQERAQDRAHKRGNLS